MNPTQILACLLAVVLPGQMFAAETNAKPYEIMISVTDKQLTFAKPEDIVLQAAVRDLGVKKMDAPSLWWGLSIVWDGKAYELDPKYKGVWNGPMEIISKTSWVFAFGVSEYRIPAERLAAGRHTVALKDAFAESNTLTIFIDPKQNAKSLPKIVTLSAREVEQVKQKFHFLRADMTKQEAISILGLSNYVGRVFELSGGSGGSGGSVYVVREGHNLTLGYIYTSGASNRVTKVSLDDETWQPPARK
jgi:hypothetical protein